MGLVLDDQFVPFLFAWKPIFCCPARSPRSRYTGSVLLGASILVRQPLRMCQAWMGIFAKQFPAFCTTWRASELLQYAFTALDLITRPSPFRATMCFSVWKRFPNYVPRCHISVMTTPPSMLTSLQSLISRFAVTRNMTLVRNVRCMFNNPRKHRRVNRNWTSYST